MCSQVQNAVTNLAPPNRKENIVKVAKGRYASVSCSADDHHELPVKLGRPRKEQEQMKIFLWENSLTDHYPGMVVAIAPSEERARQAVYQDDPSAAKGIEKTKPTTMSIDRNRARAFVVWGGG